MTEWIWGAVLFSVLSLVGFMIVTWWKERRPPDEIRKEVDPPPEEWEREIQQARRNRS